MICGGLELFVKVGIIDLADVQLQSMNKKSLNLLTLCDELTTKEARLFVLPLLIVCTVKLV